MGVNLHSITDRLKSFSQHLGLSLVVDTELIVQKVKPYYPINFKNEPPKKEEMFCEEVPLAAGVEETVKSNPLGTGDEVREDALSILDQTMIDDILATPNTTGYQQHSGEYPLYKQSVNINRHFTISDPCFQIPDWYSTSWYWDSLDSYSDSSKSDPLYTTPNFDSVNSDPYSTNSYWDSLDSAPYSTTPGSHSVNSKSQYVTSNRHPTTLDPPFATPGRLSINSYYDSSNLYSDASNACPYFTNPDRYSGNPGRQPTNTNRHPPKPAGYRPNGMGPSFFPQPTFYGPEEPIRYGWSGYGGNLLHREATLKNECLSPASSTAYMSPEFTSSSQSSPYTSNKLYTQEFILLDTMSKTSSLRVNSQISTAHQSSQS